MAKSKKGKTEDTEEKPTKKAKGKKAKGDAKPEGKPKIEAKKYGVNDLAELLEIKPASVRVRLRNAEIPKAGKSYGWDTKKELEEVAAALYPEEEDEEEGEDEEE